MDYKNYLAFKIVHTNIRGLFDVNSFGKERYFIILRNIHVMVMSTYDMRNLKQWMSWKFFE